jgi:hypothetical protein
MSNLSDEGVGIPQVFDADLSSVDLLVHANVNVAVNDVDLRAHANVNVAVNDVAARARRRGPPIIGYHPWRQLQVVSSGGGVIESLPPNIAITVFGYSLTENDIPDAHRCPFSHQVPVDPVHWDIPNLIPHFSQQVFERSMLVRHISTLGSLNSYRNVSHPLTRQSVPRADAMSYVREVDDEIRDRLHYERVIMGRESDEADAVNDEQLAFAMRAVQNP